MTSLAQPKRSIAASETDVWLRPLRMSDRPRVRRWMADIDIVRFTVLVPGPDCRPRLPYDDAAADRYLDALVGDARRKSFAICAGGEHVGNVGLRDIDVAAGRTECFVEVCEPTFRRRGIARKAMQTLLDFALLEMKLREVALGVFDFNTSARALYSGLGFENAGHYGWHYADDDFHEVLKMTVNVERWIMVRPTEIGAAIFADPQRAIASPAQRAG